MKRFFMCLANSKKHGERCIAGIELENRNGAFYVLKNSDGEPKWIRPVSITPNGEVASKLVDYIQLKDIVEIDVTRNCPIKHQSENVFFDKKTIKVVKHVNKNLDNLVTQKDTLFGNNSNAVSSDDIATLTYSLLLIKVEKPKVHLKVWEDKVSLRKHWAFRLEFLHRNISYDLPLTDIAFEREYLQDNTILETATDIYLTVSLGTLYEKKYYKLVAGVIYR